MGFQIEKQQQRYSWRISEQFFDEYRKSCGQRAQAVYLCMRVAVSSMAVVHSWVWFEEHPVFNLLREGELVKDGVVILHIAPREWNFTHDFRKSNDAADWDTYMLAQGVSRGELSGRFEYYAIHLLFKNLVMKREGFRNKMREYIPSLVDFWEQSVLHLEKNNEKPG